MMQALQSKCNLLSFEVVRQHQTTSDGGAKLNTHTHTHSYEKLTPNWHKQLGENMFFVDCFPAESPLQISGF